MSFYKPTSYAVIMVFMASICAFQFPALGAITAIYQYLLFTVDTDPEFTTKRNMYSWIWLGICLFIGIVQSIEKILFGVTGESLTTGVRIELMKGVMYKQLCWFDSESKAPGVLTNVLSEDVTSLNGMTTETISVLAEAALGFSLSILASCYFSPLMALYTTLCTPIVLIGAWA